MNNKKSFMRAISIDKQEYEKNPDAFENWTDFCYNSDNYITLWDVTDSDCPILIMNGTADDNIEGDISSFISGCRYCCDDNIEYDKDYNAIVCENIYNPNIEPQYANILTY